MRELAFKCWNVVATSFKTRMELSETKCVKKYVLSLTKNIYIRKIIYRLWLLKVCMHSSSKGQFGPDK